MINRRLFLTTTTAAILTANLAAHAASPEIHSHEGLAINGFDPVAYFTAEHPVEGRAEFTTLYKGATWRFSSAENKAAFDATPEMFAPQYGGYCAYAASKGYIATSDPAAWTIFEGKLYLNYSKSVRALWALRKSTHIKSANENWPGILQG
ncbi:MAG: YHS domain-containing (seleno)protein [Halocynthiibacter sp.]